MMYIILLERKFLCSAKQQILFTKRQNGLNDTGGGFKDLK